ncbi:MAG: flagellar biosynthesis protein [Planctomycetota bacterium]|jgi:flagellar biosynthesis protein
MSAPTRRAVGLHYEASRENAPKVVAKGSGEVAERIVSMARESGVPIEHNPDLVELLAVSEVGDEIPSEVFGAVARLITFLWAFNGERLSEG